MGIKTVLLYPASTSELEEDALLYQPLALAYVAAYLPEHYEIASYDEYVGRQIDPSNEKADLVFMSPLTCNIPRTYALADTYRKQGAYTVIGGAHATALPNEALEHFDTVIQGEAEPVMEQFIRDFEAGTPQPVYDGKMNASLDTIRIPRRDVIHPRYDYPSFLTSKGCPFSCSFCYLTVYKNRKYRMIPHDRVLEDLDQEPQLKYGIFTDENFIGYTQAQHDDRIALCEKIARHRPGIIWGTQASSNLADQPDLMDAMYKAGCRAVFVGVEAVGDDNLDEITKGINKQYNYKEIFARIHKHKIAIIGSCILGLDNQDKTYPKQLVRFLKDIKVDYTRLFYMTPWPGTPLHKRLDAEARVSDSYSEIRKDVPSTRYKNFTAQELWKARKFIYSRMMSPLYVLQTIFRWIFRERSLFKIFLSELWKAVWMGTPQEEQRLNDTPRNKKKRRKSTNNRMKQAQSV
jgi:radical SAM superfamily enzyme YgiQ (UPF0313 family)